MHPVLLASIALAVAGAALLVWSLRFADRDRGKRRCPRCWYSLQGLESRRCPECGTEARNEASLHRARRSRRGLIAAGALILAACLGAAWSHFFGGPGRLPPWTLESTSAAGEYRIEVLRDNTGTAPNLRRVRVRHGKREVCSLWATYPEIGARLDDGSIRGIGDDINGDRIPDLVLRDQPGNAVSSQTNLVLSLQGDGLGVPITTLGPGTFVDLDDDGVLEFRAADCSFAYAWTSGAGSPYPEVILRWHAASGRYVVALDLMRRAPTGDAVLAAIAARANTPSDELPSARLVPVLRAALDLIYTGNEQLAWGLIESSWTQMEDWPLDRFETELRDALGSGPYAAEIRELQHTPLGASAPGG